MPAFCRVMFCCLRRIGSAACRANGDYGAAAAVCLARRRQPRVGCGESGRERMAAVYAVAIAPGRTAHLVAVPCGFGFDSRGGASGGSGHAGGGLSGFCEWNADWRRRERKQRLFRDEHDPAVCAACRPGGSAAGHHRIEDYHTATTQFHEPAEDSCRRYGSAHGATRELCPRPEFACPARLLLVPADRGRRADVAGPVLLRPQPP